MMNNQNNHNNLPQGNNNGVRQNFALSTSEFMQNVQLLATLRQQQGQSMNSLLSYLQQQPQRPELPPQLPQVQPIQLPAFNIASNPYISQTQQTLNVCFLET